MHDCKSPSVLLRLHSVCREELLTKFACFVMQINIFFECVFIPLSCALTALILEPLDFSFRLLFCDVNVIKSFSSISVSIQILFPAERGNPAHSSISYSLLILVPYANSFCVSSSEGAQHFQK